jgi:tetratricopeptide (TPR) repeat protein
MRVVIYCLGVVWLGCQGAALTSAKLYLQEGENQKAGQKLEQALLQEPQNPEIHFLLGKVAALDGDYETMNSAFEKARGLSPEFNQEIDQLRHNYWATEYNEGVALATSEKADLAVAGHFFRRAITVDPEPLESWRNLAYVLYHLDSLEVAIQAYEHIVARSPADSTALANLGALYLGQERYQEAVQTLRQLLEVNPTHLNAHINLGVAFEHLEQLAEAEKAYRQAILLDPQLATGHYNLGTLYWNRKDYEKAIAAYKTAVELSPEDNNALYSLAVSHLSIEDWDGALPLLEELAERMPDNPLVWNELGRIYAIKGQLEKSKQAYEETKHLRP